MYSRGLDNSTPDCVSALSGFNPVNHKILSMPYSWQLTADILKTDGLKIFVIQFFHRSSLTRNVTLNFWAIRFIYFKNCALTKSTHMYSFRWLYGYAHMYNKCWTKIASLWISFYFKRKYVWKYKQNKQLHSMNVWNVYSVINCNTKNRIRLTPTR